MSVTKTARGSQSAITNGHDRACKCVPNLPECTSGHRGAVHVQGLHRVGVREFVNTEWEAFKQNKI